MLLETRPFDCAKGPFFTPHHPRPLYVTRLPDPAHLPPDTLDKIVCAYRDIFGHGAPVDTVSWGEYAKCTNAACNHTLSIEDITGQTSYHHISMLESSDASPLPACPSCSATMELFYQPAHFRERLRHFFSKDIAVATLVDAEGGVHGVAYAWRDTLRAIWDERFSEFYRDMRSELTREAFLDTVTRETREWIRAETEVLYYAEVGVTVPARTAEGSFALTSAVLEEFGDTHANIASMPVVCSAIPNARSYQLFVAGGGMPVCAPADAPLVVLADRFDRLRERMALPYQTFMTTYRRQVAALLRQQRQHPHTPVAA